MCVCVCVCVCGVCVCVCVCACLGVEWEGEEQGASWVEEADCALTARPPVAGHGQDGSILAPLHAAINKASFDDGGMLVATRAHQDHLAVLQVQGQSLRLVLIWDLHPLQANDANAREDLGGGDEPTVLVLRVQLNQLADTAAHDHARVVSAPRGTEQLRRPVGTGVVRHKGADVESARPQPASHRRPH